MVNRVTRTVLFAASALLSISALGAGAARFGTLRNSDWVVTNAWQAVSNKTHDLILEIGHGDSLPPDWQNVSNAAMNAVQSLQPAYDYTDNSLISFSSTGSVFRSLSYGTPTRWTDATGCVWEATLVLDRWNIKDTGLPDGVSIVWNGPEWVTETDDMYYSRIGWYVSNGTITPEYLGNDASATTFVFDWSYYDTEPHLVRSVFSRPVVTNAVGRVAMTSDIPDTSGYTTHADVTAAIREQSLGGIWDEALQVWWTPRMRNGSLTYEATTNVNLNAEN